MRVLIIEDDADIAQFIKKGLKEHGHVADIALNGKEGLFLALSEPYNVLIIDRMLPQIDGMNIVKTLRNTENETPILILSTLHDVDAKVEGLRAGADDYLAKPFEFSELLARIEVLEKRPKITDSIAHDNLLCVKDLTLHLVDRKCSNGQHAIELKTIEYQLLRYLLENKGKIITRTMLLEQIWDYNFDPKTNIIEVHISRLWRKIQPLFEQEIIKTVRGAGYIVEA